jgi:SAM-dependent methyltransferase
VRDLQRNGGLVARRAQALAFRAMNLAPVIPDERDPSLRERFNLRAFAEGTSADRKRFMRAVAEDRYRHELALPMHRVFGMSEDAMRAALEGKRVMELGCFVGACAAANAERYGVGEMVGVDIDAIFLEAARRFVEGRTGRYRFVRAFGESLPFADESFDAILTQDTLEHVYDVAAVLSELRRVLRPEGRVYAQFPSWYHPWGNHLSLVTSMPWLHLVFRDSTLEAAYRAIIAERGEGAYWYAPGNGRQMDRRRFHSVNGITAARFRRLVRAEGLSIIRWQVNPVLTGGRRAMTHPWLKALGFPLRMLATLPGIEELLLNRISVVVQKPDDCRRRPSAGYLSRTNP